MPPSIADLAASFLTDPLKVAVSPPGKAADKVEQHVHFVAGQNAKTEMLKKILNDNPDGRSIVFLRTKHGAEKLMKHLDATGYSVASIHGNKSQGQRERALKGFRDGEIKTLIATDVAARGIDIPAVSHVFNYDLPEVPDAYVHRIGRTARAGRDGIAIAFCGPDEGRLLRDVEKLMGIDIPVASGEPPANLARPARPQRRGGGGPVQRLARLQGLEHGHHGQLDFRQAGQTLVVPAVNDTPLTGVARIVIDKTERSARAFDASGTLLAFYPATIGSSAASSLAKYWRKSMPCRSAVAA